jgi:hypothetical protein
VGGRGPGCSKQAGRQAEREGGIRSAFESEREVLGSGAISRESGELASGRCLPSQLCLEAFFVVSSHLRQAGL